MAIWYRGGEVKRAMCWLAKSRDYAAFYAAEEGDVTEVDLDGNFLDLSAMGVEVDASVVPVQVRTSSNEAYEWAQKAASQLRAMGYDGVIVRQWNADYSNKAQVALLVF